MFAKTFRNTLIASTLVVAGSVLAAPAMAAPDGVVSGSIAAASTVAFNPPSVAALAAGTFQMGTVDIRNNDPDGWDLDVASLTGGQLVHAASGDFVTYTALTVAPITDATITPFTPTTEVKTTVGGTNRLVDAIYSEEVAGTAGVNRAVTATLGTVAATLPSGTYSDTLTFTLTSK